MKDFRKLQIWVRSHGIALDVYRITQSFPKAEIYGIVRQMRRLASSIPTNIAEGSGRKTEKDFAGFLDNAIRFASEQEYQLLLAHDLNYLPSNAYKTTNDELIQIKRMLNTCIQKLRTKTQKQPIKANR